MRALIIALALLPALAVAQSSEWKPIDKALLVGSTAMLVVDWGQTRYIAKHPDTYHELNPILGKHPSLSRVNAYFSAAIVGNYLIAEYLIPPEARSLYLGVVTGVELAVVGRNKHLGIKLSF